MGAEATSRTLACHPASPSHRSLLNSAPRICGAPSLTHFGPLGWAPSLFSFSGPSAVISTNKSDHGYSDVRVTLMLARLGPVSGPSGAQAPSHVLGRMDYAIGPFPMKHPSSPCFGDMCQVCYKHNEQG